MMTPDELMAYRRAEAVAAANVDHDHAPATLPAAEHPEIANVRRLAEVRAARVLTPLAPGALDFPSAKTVSSPNEKSICSLDQLNSYFRDVHGYNERGFKPWVPSK